jgi:CubicO group peptidase (beta-lactamase class C family)
MQGVTRHFPPGEIEVRAFLAGNDVLVLPQDLRAGIEALKKALASGRITEHALEERVKHILREKYRMGLTDIRNVIRPLDRVTDQAGDATVLALKTQLIEEALTVVSNTHGLLPIRRPDTLDMATLMIGAGQPGMFEDRSDAYSNAQHLVVRTSALPLKASSLIRTLGDKDLVLVGIRNLSKKATERFGIDPGLREFLDTLSARTNVVVVVFGSPYALHYLEGLPTVVMAYEEGPLVEDLAVQGVFGAFGMRGKLPVSVSAERPAGHGIRTESLLRLGYAVPERVGLSSDSLALIAGIVDEMISDRAAPGCQVLVAKDGKVVFEQAFGHFTYDTSRRVRLTDLYDLASITKVAASTMSLMRLADDGKLCLDATLGEYLPDIGNTNKASLQVSSVLAHVAGLVAWIPFYEETVDQERRHVIPSDEYYKDEPDEQYCIPVATGLYMCDLYVDTMWQRILDSEIQDPGKYVYSDLGFYIFARMIERVTGKTVDAYAAEQFYRPLGLDRLLYRPLSTYPLSDIVPTEEDKYFRNQRLQGYVHDMGAAMLGGVSGHAGLFGNARSLAVIMQMLMNGGYYGGTTYLSREMIDLFTTRVQGSTRRGLGFDMKELDPDKRLLTSPLASPATYGHTGFTGTCMWNDPDANLVYIFLSNRTYPSMNDSKFTRGEYRERVHTAVYNSIQRK